MGEKVWLIFTGEYSGKQCVGYCESEDDAKRYCAINNGPDERLWAEDYYYEDVKCLSGDVKARKDEVGESVDVWVKWTRQGYLFKTPTDSTYRYQHSPTVIQSGDGDPIFVVKIWVPKWSRREKERVLKIAQDTFYQWVAEHEEQVQAARRRLERYLLS